MAELESKVLEFVTKLKEKGIWHSLAAYRYDAISVEVVVPGQRWEVDFLEEGRIDVEIFKSDGHIYDESKLDELFEKFSD